MICLFCLLAIIRKAQRDGIPIYVVDDDGAQLRWAEADDRDAAALMEGKETGKIDVREVVDVHGVIPDKPGEPYDFHTHGLERFNHPEFQVLAPGYCRAAMANLLWNHAEQVINAGGHFTAGETVTVDGVVCGYETVPGDAGDDQPRLRVVDIPGGCSCDYSDALKIRQIYDPKTLIYVDAPYVDAEKTFYAVNKRDGFDHVALRDALECTRVSLLISYEEHPLIRDLYSESNGWLIKQVDVTRSLGNNGKQARELLIVRKSAWARQQDGTMPSPSGLRQLYGLDGEPLT